MKAVYFILLCTMFFVLSGSIDYSQDVLKKYLIKQSQYVHKEVGKSSRTRTIVRNSVKYGDLVTREIDGKFENVFTFTMFDKPLLMLDDKLYEIVVNGSSYDFKYVKNSSFPSGKVKFVKEIEFLTFGVLAVTYEYGITYIYLFSSSSEYTLAQSLYHEKPSDVMFFINNNQLYLLIANQLGDNISTVLTYLWTGTNFDQIHRFFARRIVSMTSFHWENSEIIVLVQRSGESWFVVVLDFIHGKMTKIQYLEIDYPSNILPYKFQNENYIIMSSGMEYVLYWWSGSELMKWTEYKTNNKNYEVMLMTSGNTTALFSVDDKNFITYDVSEAGFTVLAESPHNIKPEHLMNIHSFVLKNFVLIIEISNLKKSEIHILPFTLESKMEIVNLAQEKSVVLECFFGLLNRTSKDRSSILKLKRRNRDTTGREELEDIAGDPSVLIPGMKKELDNLKLKITRIDDLKNEFKNKDELVLYGANIINGTVTGNSLTANKIVFKYLNKNEWSPDLWLRYKEPQVITGPVLAKTVSAKRLTSIYGFLANVLKRDGDQEISGDVEFSQMSVNKIKVHNVNNIPVDDIYLLDKPTVIKGTKTFGELSVHQASVDHVNGAELREYSMLPFVGFSDNLFVEDLYVENIDGVNWKEFKNSVFILGQSHEIKGPLRVAKVAADSLQVDYLNDNKVSQLLTTSGEQTVNSLIHCDNVYAKNASVGRINGLVLEEEAVFADGVNGLYLKDPIHMDHIEAKNLFVKGDSSKNIIKNVTPSDTLSSLQIYHGKIKVKGDVHVKNLKFLENATIEVSNKQIGKNILDEYWTKNTSQNIPVYFEAQKGIKVPHLTLTKLNNIPIKNYMTNDSSFKENTRYYFDNVKVVGNVYMNPNEKHYPDLASLEKKSVKLSGTYEIKGKKSFQNSLKVGNLEILDIEDFIENEVSKLPPLADTELDRFSNITITGNLTCDDLSTSKINGFDIKSLKDETMYRDQDYELDHLHLQNVTIDSLTVSQWNGFNMSKFYTRGKRIDHLDSVLVNGDITLKEVLNLTTINGRDVNELLKNVLEFSSGKLKNVAFKDMINVTNLWVGIVNNVHIPELLDTLVYTNVDQNITGHWTTKRLTTDDLIVKNVNNLSVEYLVDVDKQENQIIKVKNRLLFYAPVTIKSLNLYHMNDTTSNADIPYEQSKRWPSLTINGHVTFVDENTILARLFEHAASATEDMEIFLPINFTSDMKARYIHTDHLISGVNLTYIVDDALYKDVTDIQVITGHNKFDELVASYVDIADNLDTYVVGRIKIPHLDKSIIRKGSPSYFIRGNKTFFSGLQCQRFRVVNGSDRFDYIVNQFDLRPVPEVVFDRLSVIEDLNIKFVERFNLDSVLKNRMLTHGSEQVIGGLLTFDSIETKGDLIVSNINDVPANSIIFDYDTQYIQSPKTFMDVLTINGSMIVDYLNGIELSKVYEKALMKGEEAEIHGSVTVMQPSQMIGNVETHEINGVSFYNITNILRKKSKYYMTQKTQLAINEIHDIAKRCMEMIHSLQDEYMYMEKSTDVQLAVPNALHAQAVSIKGFILIHILKEEAGSYCSLSDQCTCGVQETLQITPHNSVVSFNNKDYRRVYSFDDETATYHFITNSTSYSESCRQNSERMSSEVSMLTWNTVPTKTRPGGFYMHQHFFSGYISDVEYFTIKNSTFIVIGRYYDPIYNSYDLDCIVLKLSDNKTTAEQIQTIPTRGARTLKLFHSANGIILIIGNAINYSEQDFTQIFRFDDSEMQFHLLRKVPSLACSSAAGVVFGSDSMIILAHERAPLQILKYEKEFDNYYFYQSLELDNKVISVSVFYIKDFGISDAYLCVVTENNRYYIYTYRYIEGWVEVSSAESDGVKSLIPFTLNESPYLFVGSSEISSLLRIVKRGYD